MITGKFVELACTDKSCAPPPVGTGGSKPRRPASESARSASLARWNKLDRADRAALSAYIGSFYIEINSALRGQYGMHESVQQLVDEMDRAFKGASVMLSDSATVYRTARLTPELEEQLTVGSTFVDKAFVSTSTTPYGTLQIAESPAMFRIALPKKTRVLAGSIDEKELILNRGSRFRVVNKSEEPGDFANTTRVVYDLELVP